MADLESVQAVQDHDTNVTIEGSDNIQQSSNSSCTTLRDSNKTDNAYQPNIDAQAKPALHHILELRADPRDPEYSLMSEELAEVKWFSWSRYAIFNIYRRLFSLVFLGNLAAFISYMVKSRSPPDLVNAAAANLLVLGLARQPLMVNLLFRLFCAVPRSAPLRIRRLCCKIYCYGGVHSGCGIASLFWYIGFTVTITKQYVYERQYMSRQAIVSPTIMVITYIILALLLAVIIAAYPKIRFLFHDYFEVTHRFCGWAVVALFWPLIMIASIEDAEESKQSLGAFLVRFPAFWMLIITTLAILHPWILLRRVGVTPESISTHAIRLHFHHITVNFGQGIQLAKNPLGDWHSFASFPDVPSLPGTNGSVSREAGFSCLISKAGDWTSDTINAPPTYLYMRGIPIYGFGYAMRVFSRIIVVTTGSGIGPCLSFLGDPNRPALRVVWQTKSPLKTFGQPIVDLVKQLDAEVKVIDTSVSGRVDMLPLVMRLVREFGAEAVCVISNPPVTRKLVFECESRGMPAFGPIFDS